jgi:hypothetical protein
MTLANLMFLFTSSSCNGVKARFLIFASSSGRYAAEGSCVIPGTRLILKGTEEGEHGFAQVYKGFRQIVGVVVEHGDEEVVGPESFFHLHDNGQFPFTLPSKSKHELYRRYRRP